MNRLITAILLSIACCAVQAEGNAYALNVSDLHQYAVSGVLRKSTTDIVLKLVQTVEVARSQEEAIGQFARKIGHDYPEYSIWDTVVSPLPAASCGTSI